MSMPALLSHFGINTARYVTVTGEVVFDAITKSGSTFTHATQGRVTPVVEHTFHGGDDEPEDTSADTAWWDDADELNRHVVTMKESFPHFLYLPADESHAPCWAGEINTGRGRFNIGVVLRRDRGLPTITLISAQKLGMSSGRTWIPSPHLYLNGNPCVADRADWNPDEHTAATATAWAAHWFAAYTEWRIIRRWPVNGVRAVAA